MTPVKWLPNFKNSITSELKMPVHPSQIEKMITIQGLLFIFHLHLIRLSKLTPQPTSKSRDELLGQGRVTLFWKPAGQEDGGLVSRRIFSKLESRLL